MRRRVDDFGRSRLGIERNLHDARAISQIDEGESAQIASAMDPAAQPDGLSDVAGAKGAAEMRAKSRSEMVRVHQGMVRMQGA